VNRGVKDWLLIGFFLLDDVAVVALVVLGLHFLGVDMPLSGWLALAVVLGGFVFLSHKIIIPSFHRKMTTGSEGMVGTYGVVIEPLAPLGRIKIAGEYWKARAFDETLDIGEHVEVIRIERLLLHVRRRHFDSGANHL
jgi:membrane-bound ClpP family serine protease